MRRGRSIRLGLVVGAAALIPLAAPRWQPALAEDGPAGGEQAGEKKAGKVELVDPGVPGDPMGVTVHRLSNGITVMLSENHEDPRLDAWITTRAGGAKDPQDATGMAHYLEHMQFKGTPKLGTLDWEKEKPHLDRITELYDQLFAESDGDKRAALYKAIDAENQEASKYAVPNEFDRLYDALGGQGLNAFTNYDQTSYTVSIPSNRLEQWAKVETERLRAPVYRLFQTEIEAVYEEKNRAMDNAGRATYEALLRALFPKHPYGMQSVLGHVEHLKNPSVTKMYDFFRDWYAPGNLCIALSGDFEKAKVLPLLESTLGTLPPRKFPADPVWTIEPIEGVRRAEVKFKGEEEVQIAFLLPPETHPDHPALVLCDMMLANGKTGLIDRNLNQAQKVRAAGCSPAFYLDAGFQTFSANPKPGQTLEELEALILEQIALLKKGEFTADDLAAVLTDFEIQKKRELESNRSRVALMTEAFLQRVPWAAKVGSIDALRKVTREQVIAAAAKYYGSGYVVVRRINEVPDLPKITKPGFTPVPIDASRRSAWCREVLETEAPQLEPRFVEKGRDVIPMPIRTGTLVVAPNPLNDVFDLTFTFETGTDQDPRLSTAFALLDLGGAGDLDGVALKRKLYALGSTIGGGAGRDECTVSVSGLDANLAATVDLLKEHFARPTGVGQADLDKMLPRIFAQRKAAKASPNGIAAALSEYAQRGEESYFLRQPASEEMAKWKAEDLLGAVRDLWRFRRTVSYVGKLPAAEVAKIVDFVPDPAAPDGGLSDLPARKPLVYRPAPKDEILLVDRPSKQTSVQLFAADGTFDKAEVPLQRTYNEYMSGSMGAVVFQEVRESRALAYDAGTGYRTASWRSDENLMTGSLGTQADKTAEALEVLLGLVRKMPATPARFDAAVHSIDQSYRASRIPFRRLPGVWVSWVRQGLDGDPRPWNWEQVREMKLESLSAWAQRFESKPFVIAVCGPKAEIDVERLGKIAPVRELKVDELFSW